MGGVSSFVAFYGSPLAVLGYGVVSPWVTNAFDLEYKEDASTGWQWDIVGNPSRNSDGTYIEKDKTWDRYKFSSTMESATNVVMWCWQYRNHDYAISFNREHSEYNRMLNSYGRDEIVRGYLKETFGNARSNFQISIDGGRGNGLEMYMNHDGWDFNYEWEYDYIPYHRNTSPYYIGGNEKNFNTFGNSKTGQRNTAELVKCLSIHK